MSSLTDIKSLLGTNLPNNILPVRKYNHEQSTNYLKYVLKKNLPKSDNKNLTNDFHWQFLLDRHSFQKKKRLQKKKSFLSRKQRSELNLLKLPKTGWSYSSLQAIRSAWKDYMKENLNLLTAAPDCAEQDWNSFSTIVGKSELVGAEMSVIKSKVPSLVGMKGTVVLESKMTFQIVTESSKLKSENTLYVIPYFVRQFPYKFNDTDGFWMYDKSTFIIQDMERNSELRKPNHQTVIEVYKNIKFPSFKSEPLHWVKVLRRNILRYIYEQDKMDI